MKSSMARQNGLSASSLPYLPATCGIPARTPPVAFLYLGALGAVPDGHRVVEPELLDARGNLVYLLVGVNLRVVRVWDKLLGRHFLDRKLRHRPHMRSFL